MQYVAFQNFCLSTYERWINYLKQKAQIWAGPPRQDYWLLNGDQNKGRVYSMLFDVPNHIHNELFEFRIEHNRIHKVNSNHHYVRLPYIMFEYVRNNERVDLSDWIHTLRISQNYTIDKKTLLELYSVLHQRVFDYTNAQIHVMTREGTELRFPLN